MDRIDATQYDGWVPSERGPITPEKYPIPPKPNYYQFGEVQGYVYDPYTDSYQPDPQAQQSYYEQTGFIEPEEKPPGLWDQVKPLAIAGGAVAAGTGLGKDPTAFVGGIKDGVVGAYEGAKGLLGGGPPPGTPAGPLPGTVPGAPGVITDPSGAAVGTAGAPAPAAAPPGTPAPSSGLLGLNEGTAAVEFGPAPQPAGFLGIEPATIGANLQSIPGAAGYAVPAAIAGATYLGGKSALDQLKGKETKGAADWIGRGTLGIATGGLSEIANKTPLKGLLGSSDTWKTEGNRLGELEEEGIFVPQNLLDGRPTGPRSRSDLINQDLAKDFIGRDASGNWVNNKFAESRDEADLRAEDIVNYATFAEQDPLWFQKSLEERLDVAGQALNAGAVREHHGTIDIDWKKFSPAQAPRSTTQRAGYAADQNKRTTTSTPTRQQLINQKRTGR